MIRRGGSGPKTIVTAGRDIVPNGDHAGLSKQQWGEFVNGEKRFGFSWDGDNLVVHKSSGTSPNAFPPTQQDISYIVKELQNSGLELRFIFIDVGKKYMKYSGKFVKIRGTIDRSASLATTETLGSPTCCDAQRGISWRREFINLLGGAAVAVLQVSLRIVAACSSCECVEMR